MSKHTKRGMSYVPTNRLSRAAVRIPSSFDNTHISGTRLIIRDFTIMRARGGTFLCAGSDKPYAALRSTAFLSTRNERLGIRLRIAG